MDLTPDQSMALISGFMRQDEARDLEEKRRNLEIVAKAIVTSPIRSEVRCLCQGCYQMIGYSQV